MYDAGDYVVIWKRANRQWKQYRDIWTTNTPAPVNKVVRGFGPTSPRCFQASLGFKPTSVSIYATDYV
ncbi:hypothetical protein B0G84_8624 [Paraburkholderia sp. BL8N3]|nr:hypothetical protein B0G84_8624 [Paraburkholderia sp. BL8N3]